jgi:hypothetical protein
MGRIIYEALPCIGSSGVSCSRERFKQGRALALRFAGGQAWPMFTRFLIMHGLISYLLWDALFIPFLIRLAFLGDRGGLFEIAGCGLQVSRLPCHCDPDLREALGVDG